MSRNANGVYSLPSSAFLPSTTISSAAVNADFTDIGTEITTSLSTQGKGGMGAPLQAVAGALAAPGYTFGSDVKTGFWLSGSHQIQFVYNGTAGLTLNSDGSATLGTGAFTCGALSSGAITSTGALAITGALTGATTGAFSGAVGTGNLTVTGTGSVTGKLSLTSTDSVAMANGTTAQRNVAPSNGDTRYNSTTAALEFYNGAWVTAAGVAQPSAQFLTIANNSTTPNSKIDITSSGRVIVVNSAGLALSFNNPGAITLNLGTTGVDALDTGSAGTSTWYYLYYISDGSAIHTLASVTAPTAGGSANLPAGYTYQAYIGAVQTDGAGLLYRTEQSGAEAIYTIVGATNTAIYATTAPGNGASSWTLRNALQGVPKTASHADICFFSNAVTGKMACGSNAAEAALLLRVGIDRQAGAYLADTGFHRVKFIGNDTKIYFNANNVGVGSVYLIGWRDIVNAC